jgi:DNA-binding IclR family transcriptional regulator
MTQMQTPEPERRLVGADRVLAVLTDLATLPEGATLDQMVRRTGHPTATVHRALAALIRSGLATSDRRGHYVLGDEFVRLAFAFHEQRPEAARVRPLLRRLADRFGETVHYAVLDGRDVVYRAKVDAPSGAVRLTSTVGGRNPAHSTGVGKLLLAYELPDAFAVEEWAGGPLERRTERTAADADELHRRLEETRRRGFAVDDQENETGVDCVAFPIFLGSPTRPTGAVSVSALAYRTPLETLVDAAPEIRDIILEEIGTLGTNLERTP